jgi:hypothetical protein
MRRLLLKLAAPVALLLLIDALFQAGIWEPLAKPASHAGVSVRLKRALLDPALPHIDFVTLGSSRPEYGLDRAGIAAAAKRYGYVHADLSMPGSHWMTIGVLGRWLARHHPEIRGGIIALSVQDLIYAGNGSYEVGIAYPFHRLADEPLMAQHVPLKRSDPETWGVWSGLFAWRQDIRDFVTAPGKRMDSVQWYREHRSWRNLFINPDSRGDMCAFGLDSLAACDKVGASSSDQARRLAGQCRELRGDAAGRRNFAELMKRQPLPDSMRKTRDVVRREIASIHWQVPPLVVLMPTPRVWTQATLPAGLHAWALSVLQPLADEGRIQLIDATAFFDHDGSTDCRKFFDFYHQNAVGRDEFTAWLLPRIETDLYRQATR